MAWQTPKTNWGQAGQTVPIADDFNRIEENIRILGEYNRAPGYGTATGTNAKTITLEPAPTSYYDGLCFAFKNATQNTGAVTINVNGLGARPIKKPNGNDIAAGNLKANSVYTVRYNGTNFILQGEGGEYGNVTPDDVIKGVTFGTEEGLKTGTLELTGNAAAADVLSGKTFYSTNPKSKLTGSMTNRGAVNQTLTTQGGSYTIPSGYHNGSGKVTASFSNLTPENVKKDVNVGGVVGIYSGDSTSNRWIDGRGITSDPGSPVPPFATIDINIYTDVFIVAYGSYSSSSSTTYYLSFNDYQTDVFSNNSGGSGMSCFRLLKNGTNVSVYKFNTTTGSFTLMTTLADTSIVQIVCPRNFRGGACAFKNI